MKSKPLSHGELRDIYSMRELPESVADADLRAYLEDVCCFQARADVILVLFARLVDREATAAGTTKGLENLAFWCENYRFEIEGCDADFLGRAWAAFLPTEMTLEEKLYFTHSDFLSRYD